MAPELDHDRKTTRDGPPGIAEDNGVEFWTHIANQHWLKSSKSKKVKADVIRRDIWDALEKEDFQFRSLLVLENLQLLEQYAQ